MSRNSGLPEVREATGGQTGGVITKVPIVRPTFSIVSPILSKYSGGCPNIPMPIGEVSNGICGALKPLSSMDLKPKSAMYLIWSIGSLPAEFGNKPICGA